MKTLLRAILMHMRARLIHQVAESNVFIPRKGDCQSSGECQLELYPKLLSAQDHPSTCVEYKHFIRFTVIIITTTLTNIESLLQHLREAIYHK